MRKETKLSGLDFTTVEVLSKVDQIMVKGGNFAMGFAQGCPPPVDDHN